MNHAMRRLGLDLRRGFWGLRTVRSTAYLAGMLGTLSEMDASFGGVGADRFTIMMAIIGGLGHAQIPQAIGLLVAVQAWWTLAFLERLAERLEEQARCSLRSFPRP